MQLATQVHEIEPRSSGKNKLVLENQVPLCDNCHNRVHTFGANYFAVELHNLRQARLESYGSK
jgi:5-methylcytosine-specific restriction endonuclease McrA